MKNLIYFNNYNKNKLLSNNLVINDTNLNKKNIKISDKILLYTQNVEKIKHIFNIPVEYQHIISLNYLKIFTSIILHICQQYTSQYNTIPHIIINSNNNLSNICKKLKKYNLIDYSIIDNIDLLENIKKSKLNNTIICIINNFNNHIIYDLKKISTYCKYYNINLMTNVENDINIISNNNDNYFINQDIFIYNYNIYNIELKKLNNKQISKNISIYYIFIKKKIINNFNLANLIQNYIINKKNFFNYYLLNTLDILKSIEIKQISKTKLLNIYQYIFNILKSKYKIVSYFELSNNNKLYYNSPTIIIFDIPKLKNNIKISYLLNNIYFSLYIPKIQFTNEELIDYFKQNKILLNYNITLPFIVNKHNIDIKKGIINLIFNEKTELIEIDTFFNILSNFIDKVFHLKVKRKKKKSVSFSNPEYTIFKHKIYNPINKINKKIKGIIKI